MGPLITSNVWIRAAIRLLNDYSRLRVLAMQHGYILAVSSVFDVNDMRNNLIFVDCGLQYELSPLS